MPTNLSSERSREDAYPALFGVSGRSGFDPPLTVKEGQCVEALNIDWFGSSCARKRGGSDALDITGGTAFSSSIRAMSSFLPGDDQTLLELFAMDGAGLFKRLAGGTAWANVTLTDAVTSVTGGASFATVDGKLYVAYKSGVNRLHVYDPVSAKLRRCGLSVSAAPTVANTGAGAYAPTARSYKVRFEKQVAGVNVLYSELSPSVSFTPSGAGTAARITKPATISEDETHWSVFGSLDGSIYHLLSEGIAVGTTTYDDSIAPTAYNGETPDEVGTYFPPPSAKFLRADDARIIMAGAYETAAGVSLTPSSRAVWWTSPPTSTGIGDNERVENSATLKSYEYVDEAVTGISDVVNGSFSVFSFRSQWQFVGTGVGVAPYQKYKVAGGAGCISHWSIVTANDASGAPSTYWLSPIGPMRRGSSGQQYLGMDVLDIWHRVNRGAVTPPHAVYHEDKHQVWFWIPVDSSDTPNYRIVYDTYLGKVVAAESGFAQVRGGWSVASGGQTKAYCSAMFSNTVGAAMSQDLKPYIGQSETTAIWKCDTADLDDEGTAFQAYVEGRPLSTWGLGRLGGINSGPTLIANASRGVTLTLTLIKDEYADSDVSSCDISPTSTGEEELTVFTQFEGAALSGANTIRIRVGDEAAIANTWNIHAVILPATGEGSK